jgi:hypothetical protein
VEWVGRDWLSANGISQRDFHPKEIGERVSELQKIRELVGLTFALSMNRKMEMVGRSPPFP